MYLNVEEILMVLQDCCDFPTLIYGQNFGLIPKKKNAKEIFLVSAVKLISVTYRDYKTDVKSILLSFATLCTRI